MTDRGEYDYEGDRNPSWSPMKSKSQVTDMKAFSSLLVFFMKAFSSLFLDFAFMSVTLGCVGHPRVRGKGSLTPNGTLRGTSKGTIWGKGSLTPYPGVTDTP